MKNIIYQYWDGNVDAEVSAGRDAMKEYAERIGATYLFEDNPKFRTDLGKYSPHYGAFKPIYDDRFREYDYVLFADTDVFPTEGLKENIFEQFVGTDIQIGICSEWKAPENRITYDVGGINHNTDERWVSLVEKTWPVKMPRTKEGNPEVYNSGVVVYSRDGRERARKVFMDFKEYVTFISNNGFPDFYTCDQPYLHAMLQLGNFKWITMDYKWNNSVHFVPQTQWPRPVNDYRGVTGASNFVHIQLSSTELSDKDCLWKIVNSPIHEWVLEPKRR